MSKLIGAGALLIMGMAWVAAAPSDGVRAPSLEPRLSEARSRVAAADRALQRLDDERAIETLQRTYGYFVDKALWKETADLFADDATLEIGGSGVFIGKARILQYLTSIAPDGLTRGLLLNHIQLQPVVTVTPDGAAALGRWRYLAQIAIPEKNMYDWRIGTYENEYVKQNGVWKINSLHAYLRMQTPYAAGWANVAGPDVQPSKELSPDRPPTVRYEPYPGTYIPPYHYANPVTGR